MAFFLSGVAGLSYEITWVQYLTDLFGASTPAVSATVSVFFAGMALGAAWGGRYFDHVQRPLRAYAFLELCIGLTAACVPFLFAWLNHILPSLTAHGHSTTLLLAISGGLLLFPTTLLGATFPAMAAVLKRQSNPTHSTGMFYGFNTLGAVLGSLLISFWWLPQLGRDVATWTMALINGGIASLLFLLYAFPSSKRTPSTQHENASVEEATSAPSIPRRMAIFLAASSGFLSIGTEILWTRALALTFPVSAHVFALVLAAYLVGIGLGSLWLGRQSKKHALHHGWLIVMYIGVAAGSLLALALFPQLMPWSERLLAWGWLKNWSGYLGWIGMSSVWSMLLATFAMGAALPLLIGLATKEQTHASQTAGHMYALNTIGGVLGSLSVTFFLMPQLGLERTLLSLSIGYMFLSVCLASLSSTKTSTRGVAYASLSLGCLMFAMGYYPQLSADTFPSQQRVLFHKDKASATYQVIDDHRGHRALKINHKSGLRHTAPHALRLQYRLGHIPMLLRKETSNALLVGFATGATLAAMSQHHPKRLECIEKHHTLFDLSRHFHKTNDKIWQAPHVTLHTGDAQRFLRRHRASYDLIMNNLHLPQEAGSSSLYSRAHFRAASKRLRKTGWFVLWLPLFQLTPQQIGTILRDFLQIYPHAEAWVGDWNPRHPVLGLFGAKTLFTRRSHFLTTSAHTLRAKKRPFVSSRMREEQFLDRRQLLRWSQRFVQKRSHHMSLEAQVARALLESNVQKSPLFLQNIRQLEALRSLQGTPWFGLRAHHTSTQASRVQPHKQGIPRSETAQ
tara:strand:+ start:10438 stop:12816 length:2379 start_codon:yes stop_codon:yes gene_type:complete